MQTHLTAPVHQSSRLMVWVSSTSCKLHSFSSRWWWQFPVLEWIQRKAASLLSGTENLYQPQGDTWVMKGIKASRKPDEGYGFLHSVCLQTAVPGWSQRGCRASLTCLWHTVQSVCRLSREHCPPPPDTGLMWSTCQKCPSPGFLIISLSCSKNTRSALLSIRCGNGWFCLVQSCLYSTITAKSTLRWLFIAFIVNRKKPLG